MPHVPEITLLLDGTGFSADLTARAQALPTSVGLILSPYLPNLPTLIADTHAHGHAIVLSLPMQPTSDRDDEGPHALTNDHTPEENEADLGWSLARIPDPDAITDAAQGLDGSGFVTSPAFTPVARHLEHTGPGFIEANPDRKPPLNGLIASIVLNADQPPEAIARQLAQLEADARQNGSALGITTGLTPALLTQITTWLGTLGAYGLILAPLSHTTVQTQSPLAPITPVGYATASPDAQPDTHP